MVCSGRGRTATNSPGWTPRCGDWVVTPRRSKAVEINALWNNALCLYLEKWLREDSRRSGSGGRSRNRPPARVKGFNARLLECPRQGFLYDVVDGEGGDDPACRPNRVFCPFPPSSRPRPRTLGPVLGRGRKTACWGTPVGLRAAGPGGSRDYKSHYFGDPCDPATRPTIRAPSGPGLNWSIPGCLLKLHPDDHDGGPEKCERFRPHLGEACVGSISEVFDAEALLRRGLHRLRRGVWPRCYAVGSEIEFPFSETADVETGAS